MYYHIDTFFENIYDFFTYEIYYFFHPHEKLVEEYLDKLYFI